MVVHYTALHFVYQVPLDICLLFSNKKLLLGNVLLAQLTIYDPLKTS